MVERELPRLDKPRRRGMVVESPLLHSTMFGRATTTTSRRTRGRAKAIRVSDVAISREDDLP